MPLVNSDAQVIQEKRMSLRRLVADRLGFGSHFTYQNAKKIKLYASVKLIDQVDQLKISVSKGTKLCSDLVRKKKIVKKKINVNKSEVNDLSISSQSVSSNEGNYALSNIRCQNLV